MFKQYYEVIEEFDSKKDYGIEMRKQYVECLSVLKKGDKVNPLEIARNYLNSFTKKPRKFETNKDIAYHSFGIGIAYESTTGLNMLTGEKKASGAGADKWSQQ